MRISDLFLISFSFVAAAMAVIDAALQAARQERVEKAIPVVTGRLGKIEKHELLVRSNRP